MSEFDIQQVRELLELMAQHDLSEIRLRQGDTMITLRKGGKFEPVVMSAVPGAIQPHAAPPSPAAVPVEPVDETAGLVPILSPMVGTFYGSSDPESPAFVSVGSEVEPITPVCIIEAMKVFNEIRAEVSGTIERILVRNEQPVEYGQPLMLVRPRG